MEEEVGTDEGSITKGKGKSAKEKDDSNMAGPHIGDPDKDKGSQGIDADQVDLAEFLHDIKALLMLGSHHEGRRDNEMVACKRRVNRWDSMGETIWIVHEGSAGHIGRGEECMGRQVGGICVQDMWMGSSMCR